MIVNWKLIAAGLLASMAGTAQAVEPGQPAWYYTGQDDTSGFWFVDVGSIHASGSYKRAWIGYHREPEGMNFREVDFSHILAEFDCTGRRQRYLHVRSFYERGKLIGASDVQQSMQYVAPGTLAMDVMLTVCRSDAEPLNDAYKVEYLSPVEWSKKWLADLVGRPYPEELDPVSRAAFKAADDAVDFAVEIMSDAEKQAVADANAARIAKGLPSK